MSKESVMVGELVDRLDRLDDTIAAAHRVAARHRGRLLGAEDEAE